jgi:hypothetical protein
MTCTEARPLLPALLYGDLPLREAALVRAHLGRCESCRREEAALAEVCHLLDTLPAPEAAVDLGQLYRDAARGSARPRPRGGRGAYAVLAAAAAVMLLVLATRLELRFEAEQLVIRWGPPPAAAPPAPPPPEPPVTLAAPPTPEVEERLRLLGDLVQALAADADRRDARQQQELEALRAQILAAQQQMAQLRQSFDRDVAALYSAQFPEAKKGGPQ